MTADPVAALRGQLDALAGALAAWDRRDDTVPQPGVRRAASDAMSAIDALLGQLYGLRAELVSGDQGERPGRGGAG
jgi:hypothetical protein